MQNFAYTDAACDVNHSYAIGCFLIVGEMPRTFIIDMQGKLDAFYAEACTIRLFIEYLLTRPDIIITDIYTDSLAFISHYYGGPCRNGRVARVTKRIRALIRKFKHNINIKYVRAHDKNCYNYIVDKVCTNLLRNRKCDIAYVDKKYYFNGRICSSLSS